MAGGGWGSPPAPLQRGCQGGGASWRLCAGLGAGVTGAQSPQERSAARLCPAVEMLVPEGSEAQKLLERDPRKLAGRPRSPGLGARPAGTCPERDSGQRYGCAPRSPAGNSRDFVPGRSFSSPGAAAREPQPGSPEEPPGPGRAVPLPGAAPGGRGARRPAWGRDVPAAGAPGTA